MAAEDWDHGNPMWEACHFTECEIGAFHAVRLLTEGVRYRRRTRELRAGRVISRAFAPFLARVNPGGEDGLWKLLFKEEQIVQDTPDRLGRKGLITARHVLSVSEVVIDEEYPVNAFHRPRLDLWEERGFKLIVPDNPRALLARDLYPELLMQAEYVSWLEVAKATANSA